MTWLEIRAYYAALHAQARAVGATQEAIAAQGGTGQNNVSRLLSNDRRGPSVEIFVRAVEGLGLSLSQFFAEFEAAVAARTEELAASQASPVEARAVSSVSASSSGRPSHGGSTLSDGRRTQDEPAAPLDQQQIQTLLDAATEGILARLDRIDARVAELGGDDGPVPARKPPARRGHRRGTTNLTEPARTNEERV